MVDPLEKLQDRNGQIESECRSANRFRDSGSLRNQIPVCSSSSSRRNNFNQFIR